MERKTANWVTFSVAIVVILLVLELALRVSGVVKKQARFTCYDPVIGKVYCPSTEGAFNLQGYTNRLKTNSVGMLDDEYPVDKPDGTARIVLLGDSFAASEYLQPQERFDGLLEKSLSNALAQPVEVLNFAMSGSDTWEQLQMFHLRAVQYQPDIVLLSFYWGNDVTDNTDHLGGRGPDPRVGDYQATVGARLQASRKEFNKWLWNQSLLYQVARTGSGKLERRVKAWFRSDYLEELNTRTLTDVEPQAIESEPYPEALLHDDPATSEDDLFFFEDSEGWSLTRELISKLNDEVRGAGARLVVLHFPSEALVASGYPLPVEAFDAFLAGQGITSVSLYEPYRSMRPQDRSRYFIQGDGHWTPEGHRLVADRLEPMLIQLLAVQAGY